MLRILFPTDFSETCNNTLQYIIELAAYHPLQVDLLHIFDIPTLISSNMPYGAVEGMVEEKKEKTRIELDHWRNKLSLTHRGKIFARYGSYPSSVIQEQTLEYNYDLIIMGLREKYNLLDKTFGSVTLHSIYKTNIPVLAIPFTTRFKPIEHVLFPTEHPKINNAAEAEKAALKIIEKFITPFKYHKIHMLHVDKNTDNQTPKLSISNQPAPNISYTLASAGRIDQSIRAYIEEYQPDLLVFKKIHRGFWEKLFHTSITKEFLFKSNVPVFIL